MWGTGRVSQLTGKAVRAAEGHRAVAVAQCVAPIRDVGNGVVPTEHNRAASVVHEALVAPIGAPKGGEPRSRLSKADDEEETKEEHSSAPITRLLQVHVAGAQSRRVAR